MVTHHLFNVYVMDKIKKIKSILIWKKMKIYQHLWGAIKAVLRGNFIIVRPYIKK